MQIILSVVWYFKWIDPTLCTRDVHLVTSWDDKGPVKIQKALEGEFDTFISGVKDVRYLSVPRFSITQYYNAISVSKPVCILNEHIQM